MHRGWRMIGGHNTYYRQVNAINGIMSPDYSNVSRDAIRLVMNRWREEGPMEILGKGRDAKWRKINEKR